MSFLGSGNHMAFVLHQYVMQSIIGKRWCQLEILDVNWNELVKVQGAEWNNLHRMGQSKYEAKYGSR